MDKLRRILFNKKGSSLVVVLVVFASITILGTALITVVSSSYDSSIYYHRQQQAELTAKSVMDTMQSAIADTTTCENIVKTLIDNKDVAYESKMKVGDSSTNMGSAKVTMEYIASKERIQIDVLSDFQGTNASLSAVMKRGKNSIDPLDFNIFAIFGGLTVNNTNPDPNTACDRTTIAGQVMTRGSLSASNCDFGDNLVNAGAFTAANCKFDKKVINWSDANVTIGSLTKLDPKRFFTTHDKGSTFTVDPGATDLSSVALTKESFVNTGISKTEIGIDLEGFVETKPVACGYIANSYYDTHNLQNGHYLHSAGKGSGVIISAEGVGVEIDGVSCKWEHKYNRKDGISETADSVPASGSQKVGTGENEMIIKNGTHEKTVTLADGVVINFTKGEIHFPNKNGTGMSPNYCTLGYGAASTYIIETLDNTTDKHTLDEAFIDQHGNITMIPTDKKILQGTIGNIPGEKSYKVQSAVQGNVVFDTTSGDVNIFAPEGLTLAKETTFNIKGDNSVHIILGEGAAYHHGAPIRTVDIGPGCDIGAISGKEVANDDSGVQLYVWGTTNSIMNVGAGSSLKIATYLVGDGTNYVDKGSAMVKGSITANGVSLTDPNLIDGKEINYSYLPPLKRPLQRTTLRTDKYFMYPKAGANAPFQLDYWGKIK